MSRLHKCPHRCTLVSSQASNRIATLVRRLISIIIDLHIPATVAFEEKYGSQLELIFRFIDRALAIGVLA
ncbi:hypothetical protein KOI56_21430 [Escherichia coli]|nr:hypothetical protein [Escherichia coli]